MKNLILISLILFLCYAVTGTSFAVSPVTDGLVKQVDASTLDITDGESVTVWPDLAGYQDMQGYGLPIFKTGIINGKPVVRFDGTSGFNAANATTGLFSGDQPHTVFTVLVSEVFEGSGVWQIGHDGSGLYAAHTIEAEDAVGCRMGNGWNKLVPDPVYTLNTPHITAISYPGGGYSNYALDLDGVSAANAANNPSNMLAMTQSNIRIGNRDVNASGNFVGDIAEVIIYNRVLNDVEVRNVGGYLTAKYGLTTAYGTYTPATLVSPGDREIDVEVDATLQWSSTSGAAQSKVYLGTDPNSALTLIGTTSATFIDPDITSNETYFWQVVEQTNASDPNTIYMSPVWKFSTVNAKPVFDPPYGQQPENASALEDATVELIAMAGVSPGEDTNISYQWLKDGAPLSGETGTTLTLANLIAADDGRYVCQATNSAGTSDSKVVRVKVVLMIGHWPLDDDTYVDVVGGNDATALGEPVLEAGIDGQAVRFNGLGNQIVQIPDTAMGTDTSFTLMFWEKTDIDSPDNNGYMCSSGTPAPDPPDGASHGHERLYLWHWHNLDYNCDYYGVLYFGTGGPGALNSAGDYPRGQWHHHAFTYNEDTREYQWYVDGMVRYNGTLSAAFPGMLDFINLGNRRDMARPYQGLIDDFRLYNAPLPREIIARIYTDLTGGSICLESIAYDLNGDCKVDLADFAMIAQEWLECNLIPASACD